MNNITDLAVFCKQHNLSPSEIHVLPAMLKGFAYRLAEDGVKISADQLIANAVYNAELGEHLLSQLKIVSAAFAEQVA